MTTKTTKKDYFMILRGYAEANADTNAIAFIDHELELLAKKNSTKTDTLTPHQVENNEITERILNALRANDSPVLFADLVTNLDVSGQRVSALVKPLVDNGTVVRSKVKGKIYYALA